MIDQNQMKLGDMEIVTEAKSRINKIPLLWIKKLFCEFGSIWLQKWYSNFLNERETIECAKNWQEALDGMPANAIKEAISYCRDNLEWPPSIAEFRRLCLKQYLPSVDETIQKAIRRDFNNPIIHSIYLKIGSWDFSHDSEKVLKRKVKNELNNLSSNLSELKGISDERRSDKRSESRSSGLRKASEYLF